MDKDYCLYIFYVKDSAIIQKRPLIISLSNLILLKS